MVNKTSQSQTTVLPFVGAIQRCLNRKALGFAAIALLMAMAGSLSAQTFRGTILGTVNDPNCAVLPIASVSARNIANGIERNTTSDEVGNYSIAEVPTGTYAV